MAFDSMEIVYEDYLVIKLDVPYKSGFLGFREVPHYLSLLEKQRLNAKEFIPNVILVDGFGILHHRGAGSATHLGLLSNIPTIGVGKSLLCFDGLCEKNFKNLVVKEWSPSNKSFSLIGLSGKNYGVAFSANGSHPVYLSIGNGVSIDTAVKIVEKLSKFRIPEPIRNSDIRSKHYL
jgi:deoxyinosine 3'endonuclease (endonuclease V)